jgi:hypothetical protein
MADLHMSYDKLRRAIGVHLGIGRDPDNEWDANHEADVEACIESGLRASYWPVLDEKTGESYRWSFLEKDVAITLVAGTTDYSLPSEFGSLTGTFTYPDGNGNRPIAPITHQQLRQMRSRRNVSGAPLYCSILEGSIATGSKSSKKVSFYPTPDSANAVVVTGRMVIEPGMLTNVSQYPHGGIMLSEVILEACLAAADKLINPEGGGGIHQDLFRQHLLVAVDADRKRSVADLAAELSAWPLDGITSDVTSLEITKTYLDSAIGHYLEYGAAPDAWTVSQASHVAEIRRRGLRRFYTPQVLPGERHAHRWSFLRPIYHVDLISGKYAYEMPADFGVPPSIINYAPETSVMYRPIPVVSPEMVENRLQLTSNTGRPTVAAFRVKGSTETAGTRYEMILHPCPGEEHQLHFSYGISPDQLGSDSALPMGGQPHAQTVLEACLAEAELDSGGGNAHQNQFLICLQSSIDHDRNMAPATLGMSRDRSDGDWEEDAVYGNTHGWDANLTLYGGRSDW